VNLALGRLGNASRTLLQLGINLGPVLDTNLVPIEAKGLEGEVLVERRSKGNAARVRHVVATDINLLQRGALSNSLGNASSVRILETTISEFQGLQRGAKSNSGDRRGRHGHLLQLEGFKLGTGDHKNRKNLIDIDRGVKHGHIRSFELANARVASERFRKVDHVSFSAFNLDVLDNELLEAVILVHLRSQGLEGDGLVGDLEGTHDDRRKMKGRGDEVSKGLSDQIVSSE